MGMKRQAATDGFDGQRRRALRSATLVFGAGLPLASSSQSARARLRGITLRIQYPAHPHFERVERQFKRFTDESGIRIEAARLPYLEMRRHQLASFAKPQGDFDLLAYLILWKVEYAQQGFLRPLEPYFNDPQWSAADFAFDDLIGTYVDAIGRAGGSRGQLPGSGARLHGLPCGAETSLLVARKDMLAQHGLAMPTSYAELLKAGRLLRDKTGVAAVATRGQAGHHLTHAWLLHLTPHGGAVFDAEGRCCVHKEGGVRGTETLREIMALAPEGAVNAGFAEMQDHFLQGKAAFYLDSSNVLGVVRDPRHAGLADRLQYAMHPSGTRLSGQTGGFGLGIAGNAAQPEAAFVFLQWLLSRPVDLAMARDGGVAARWSTLAHPDFRAFYPEQSIMPYALRAANPDWRPLIPQWEHLSQDLVGQALVPIVAGQRAVRDGLSELAANVDAVMGRRRR